MNYLDRDYYDNVFSGEPVADADFPGLLARAEEIVEELCMYRIYPENMDKYGTDTQERIKKAMCAQIEYLNANGGSDMDNGVSLQSATLGKFSFSAGGGAVGGGSAEQSIYAPRAVRILAPTGLLYRGGGFE